MAGGNGHGTILETGWQFLQKFNTNLRYSPAIQLLSIHPRNEDVLTERHGSFIALFIIAKKSINNPNAQPLLNS